jgi:hypothetical protein
MDSFCRAASPWAGDAGGAFQPVVLAVIANELRISEPQQYVRVSFSNRRVMRAGREDPRSRPPKEMEYGSLVIQKHLIADYTAVPHDVMTETLAAALAQRETICRTSIITGIQRSATHQPMATADLFWQPRVMVANHTEAPCGPPFVRCP